jgi:hypothetical protein
VAKKKSQKRPAPPGVDPNEKRRERLEAKRIAKAQALAAKRKREARERIMRRVALLALLGFAVWFLFLRTATPDEINGNPIKDFSTAGANQHVSGTVPYQDSPPVSGQHAPQPTFCGVHNVPIPNETMVHNLEHGAIGLLYAPDTDPEDIETLESIVGDYEDNVFSMPYQGQMDSPIVIAAWGHTMELDTAEEGSVRQFIEEFRHGGDAPEANQVCEHQDPQPFDATPAPQETPTPTPTQGGRNRTPEPTPSS